MVVVKATPLAGPMRLPNSDTISPGDTGPDAPLALLTMADSTGGGGAALVWVIVKICVPTVMWPVRAGPIFAARLNVMGPAPMPEPEPAVICSQLASGGEELHGQPSPVFTVTRPVAAPGPKVALVGESVRFPCEPSSLMAKVGGGGVVTPVTTTIDPLRPATQPFAATV